MQLPESSRTQLTKLAEVSQREVGAGLGLWLSWIPQFPEQMQMSVLSAQGDLVRALRSHCFHSPFRGPEECVWGGALMRSHSE